MPLKSSSDTNQGKLFVVATPLGNLDDLSPRAAKTLTSVDIIAAEDTRRTRKILNRLESTVRLISCREHNEAAVSKSIIEQIKEGKNAAIVTDAGTPAVSDPGRKLVGRAREEGITIVPIPGPSAVATALSVSGFCGDSFFFGGFLPNKKTARRNYLSEFAERKETLIFYEAPHRIVASLKDMKDIFGLRNAVICRELTKINEEITGGKLEELYEHYLEKETGARIKGEITLVIDGLKENDRTIDEALIADLWNKARESGMSASSAAKDVASELKISRNEIYKIGLRLEKNDK